MDIISSFKPGAGLHRQEQKPKRLPFSETLKTLLNKKLRPGFKVGEVLAWIVFLFCWPLLMAVIYIVSGRFNDPGFMTARSFAVIQLLVSSVKALYIFPVWWLFFVKLKGLGFGKKIALHILTSALYTALSLGTIFLGMTRLLQKDYTITKMLPDIYNLLIIYVLHFSLFHAYNFWLHTQEQMKREQELRELAYQSEIMALKAQIEPHFLFNTLNSISASVPSSLEKTRVLIAQLADTFRYALRVSEMPTVSLADEIGFVKTWLALEKHRFGNRLEIRYDIDPSTLYSQIPSLIFQPLIENAIKHGISPNIEGGTVTIACRPEGKFVRIEVTDTGNGLTVEPESIFTKGVGLRNTSKRLEHLYNEKLQVVESKKGLCFSFRIPSADTK
ncbi:MAG: histidine kinase [Gemmatimonadaceae bacterium]|nr:histidine kinase [Chitinophagaceae bacterium]